MANVNRKANSTAKLPSLGRHLLWVDDAASINKLIVGLAVLCAILLLLDLVIHRHSYFAAEAWFAFYPVAGFVAFTIIVVAAKALRGLIGRDESYYSPNAVDGEAYPEQGLERLNHPGVNLDKGAAADSVSDERPKL